MMSLKQGIRTHKQVSIAKEEMFVLWVMKIVFTSLLNCVPCVLKTCSRANVPCVLTCQRALHAYVLTCKRAILNNVNSYIIQIC